MKILLFEYMVAFLAVTILYLDGCMMRYIAEYLGKGVKYE